MTEIVRTFPRVVGMSLHVKRPHYTSCPADGNKPSRAVGCRHAESQARPGDTVHERTESQKGVNSNTLKPLRTVIKTETYCHTCQDCAEAGYTVSFNFCNGNSGKRCFQSRILCTVKPSSVNGEQ